MNLLLSSESVRLHVSHASRWLRARSYQIVGPTTVHLRFEFLLLVALMLLCYSTLQGLYKDSFGLRGDFIYLSLVFLCLSRHLLVRILTTWDPSSHASPTFLGIFSHFITAHLTGGQVHDRPAAPVLSRLVGSTPNSDDVANLQWTTSRLLPSSAVYAWKFFAVRIWTPTTENSAHSRRRRYRKYVPPSTKADTLFMNEPRDWVQRTWSKCMVAAHTTWMSYGPSLHLILPIMVGLFFVAGLGIFHAKYFPFFSVLRRAWLFQYDDDQEIEWNLLAMDSRSRNAVKASSVDATTAMGVYQRKTLPNGYQIGFEMLAMGQLLGLLCFLRVLLPLPDLVSTSTRTEEVGTTARSSSKTSRTTKDNMHIHNYQQPQEAPWTERVRPITTLHRLRLIFVFVIVRLAENLFLCAFLPRSLYICRATGHCPKGTSIWELSRILHPAGISSPYRNDAVSFFAFMEWDIPSATRTIVCVGTVTIVLLTAHFLVTNKALLAIQGYLASGWKQLGPSEQRATNASGSPKTWDPRGKYRKGDLVVFNAIGRKSCVYRATENNPGGKPMDLAVFHNALQSELGHPATSQVLAQLATVQLLVAMFFSFLGFLSFIFGYSSHGSFSAFVANMVALHALVTIGRPDFSELEQLNHEIKQSVI